MLLKPDMALKWLTDGTSVAIHCISGRFLFVLSEVVLYVSSIFTIMHSQVFCIFVFCVDNCLKKWCFSS